MDVRACGGQRTTFLASVCPFHLVLEAGSLLFFPNASICEGLADFSIPTFHPAVRMLGLDYRYEPHLALPPPPSTGLFLYVFDESPLWLGVVVYCYNPSIWDFEFEPV